MAVALFRNTGAAATLLTATLSARHLVRSWKDAPKRYEDLCMLLNDLDEYRESKWELLRIMDSRRRQLRSRHLPFDRLRDRFERQSRELERAIYNLDKFLRRCDSDSAHKSKGVDHIDNFLESSLETLISLFSNSQDKAPHISRWKVGVSQNNLLLTLEKRIDDRIDQFDNAWYDLCRCFELTIERSTYHPHNYPQQPQQYQQQYQESPPRSLALTPPRQQLAIEW